MSPLLCHKKRSQSKNLSLKRQTHLLKRRPERLSLLALIFLCAGICVWMMFRNIIPVLASVLLLVSATCDFLFPMTFELTEEGVCSNGLLRRDYIAWKEVLRVLPLPDGVLLSPLPTPSRLDAFRDVTLRFAIEEEEGDRKSAEEAISDCLLTIR